MALTDTLTHVKDQIDLDLEAAGVAASSASFIVSCVLSDAWLDLVLPAIDESVVLPSTPDDRPDDCA